MTCLCTLQEEKERKEQEEQRKKLDEDAKKKKVLSNMTQQYGAGQKVQTLRNNNHIWTESSMNAVLLNLKSCDLRVKVTRMRSCILFA